MRILVTGVAGFIGSNLAEKFLADGHAVRGLDDLSNGVRENVPDGVDFIEGDIRNPRDCLVACDEAEVVFHEAALGSVPRSVEDPGTTDDVNVRGTLNMLLAARDSGVDRFVYAASSSAYGEVDGPCVESMAPRPLSPYAVSKLAAEHYCSVFWRNYGLHTVSLRYFNVFGKRQRRDGPYAAVVARWAEAMLRGESPIINGDGLQTRDFTHVLNVVRANEAAGLMDLPDKAFGQAYNVGCGRRTSLLELLDWMRRAFGSSCVGVHAEARKGEARHSVADVTKAGYALGYAPDVGVAEGLGLYAGWMKSRWIGRTA